MTSFIGNWLVQWFFAGLLLGAGFVWPVFWWLGLVGVTRLIYLAIHEPSWRRVLIGSLLAWTSKSALSLSWFWSVFPIAWLTVGSDWLQLLLILVWWLTAALWLGAGGVMFGSAVKLLQLYVPAAWLYAGLPLLWLAAELFGSLVFSIVTIGSGGSVTTAFSFGYIGYLLVGHDWLVQVAQWGGVYALGLLLVSLSSLTIWLIVKRQVAIRYVALSLGLLVCTSLIPWPHNELTGQTNTHTVVIIDTTFTPQDLADADSAAMRQAAQEAAMQAALVLEPDYVLLPEDARYFNQVQAPRLTQAQFKFRTNNPEVVIVDSGRVTVDERVVLQSFVYNGASHTVNQSQKRYLVPQGEFMPSLYEAGLKLFGHSEVIDAIADTLDYTVGTDTSQADFASSSPGVLFCFESVSPWGVRAIMQERGNVPFIAHPISHAWFNEPHILWQQLDSMLRVQAIWNQQYIVSAGNHVRGYAVTPAGTIVYPQSVASGDNWHVGVLTVPKVDR
jgi:apolipoprotein N-acyltransferase